MPEGLDQDELIERWTLVGEELERCRVQRGVNGLAFAVLWKFFLHQARFPRGRSEVPDDAVGFVARQLGMPASELGFYDWSGRTAERHRAEVRDLLGFRDCTLTDQEVGVEWLIEHGGDPAPVHPCCDPPHVSGVAGGRPGPADDLPVPLSALTGRAARG